MLRSVVAGLVLAILAISAAGGVVGDVSPDTQPALAQSAPDEFTTTTFQITVTADGNGTWTVRHSQPLETDDDREQFETFAEEFRTTETETFEEFRERAQRLTEAGSDATGREMVATGFERDAFIDERGQDTGIIEMSFDWHAIAVTNGEGAVLADIFAGGWAIAESQQLVIQPGEETMFGGEPTPEPDSGLDGVDVSDAQSVTWFGERQFSDRRPRVQFVPPTEEEGGDLAADGADERDDETSAPGDERDTDGEEGMGMVHLAVGVLLLLGIGGAAVYARGHLKRESESATDESATAPQPDTAEAEAGVPEPEIFSDEERVKHLLEENGGRMKQVNIVEETEWSKSKVSMLLSDMEEEGEISKLRVGRENIVSLAGEEPEAAGSPFDPDE